MQDLLLLWGKWDGLARPLPLLAHLLDTAAVALVGSEQWSPQVRKNAVDVLAPGDEELARARFAVLVAVHDVGKASREFNGQAWSRRRDTFEEHRKSLVAAGLPICMPARRPRLAGRESLWLRHEAVTGLILADLTDLPSWARRVVTGHHGRYQPAGAERNVARELMSCFPGLLVGFHCCSIVLATWGFAELE